MSTQQGSAPRPLSGICIRWRRHNQPALHGLQPVRVLYPLSTEWCSFTRLVGKGRSCMTVSPIVQLLRILRLLRIRPPGTSGRGARMATEVLEKDIALAHGPVLATDDEQDRLM